MRWNMILLKNDEVIDFLTWPIDRLPICLCVCVCMCMCVCLCVIWQRTWKVVGKRSPCVVLLVCVIASVCLIVRWVNIPPTAVVQTTRMHTRTSSVVPLTATAFSPLLKPARPRVKQPFWLHSQDVRSRCLAPRGLCCAVRVAMRLLHHLSSSGAINRTVLKVMDMMMWSLMYLYTACTLIWWLVSVAVERCTCDQEVAGSMPGLALSGDNSEQSC